MVEHELYHCAQEQDVYGAPRFSRATGEPIFGIRGHDSEEFVGVVRRYGVGSVSEGTRRLVEAARNAPEIPGLSIAKACGTCSQRAA
ncbi:MAG: putative metallopeptidase [bacterium]